MLNLPLPKRRFTAKPNPATPGDLVSRYAADLEKELPEDPPAQQSAPGAYVAIPGGVKLGSIQVLTADGAVVAVVAIDSLVMTPGTTVTIPSIRLVVGS